ncbi:hypothetical protein AB6N36_28285, partial [Streptomyces nitrosporeus]
MAGGVAGADWLAEPWEALRLRRGRTAGAPVAGGAAGPGAAAGPAEPGDGSVPGHGLRGVLGRVAGHEELDDRLHGRQA